MKIIAAFFSVVLLFFSCKSGSDVFATIDSGNITRSEFNDWLESRSISVDSIYKDRYAVSDYLRQIAVEKLTTDKAETSGYKNESEYLMIEKVLQKNLLATFLTEKKRREIVFNEKAADLSIIRIFLKKGVLGETRKHNEVENKQRVMANVLYGLNKGKDFNDLAGVYSEDAASRKKGHLGIIPESIMDNSIKNAIIHLKEGDYTKEPVIIGESLCLLKLHKRYELTYHNIKKIVTDKENAEKIIDFYNKKALDEIFNRVLAEKNVVSNISKISYYNKEEIIFSIDGENFTVHNLEIILNLFYALKNGMPPVDKFSLKEKKITSEKIFNEWILASEAAENFIDKEVIFQRNWFYLRRATLAGAFKYKSLIKNSMVTDEDVWNEYNRNRISKYYNIKKRYNKNVKVFLTFKEVKTLIRNQLSHGKLKSLKQKWDSDIIREGNFRIINKDYLVN